MKKSILRLITLSSRSLPPFRQVKSAQSSPKGALLLRGAFLGCALLALVTASPSAFAASRASTHSPLAVASSTSCPPTIHQGSSSDWVRAAQNALNDAFDNGYFYDSPKEFYPYTQDPSHPLRVDGDFGSRTFAAVYDFQWWEHQGNSSISVDGEVGPQTWHLLGYC